MISLEVANKILEEAGISLPLKRKWQALVTELQSLQSAVIAFSGGVDSSFLAVVTSIILGDRAIAVTVVSPLEPSHVLKDAVQFASQFGIIHDTISNDPLQTPEFQTNHPDRCYHCKTRILIALWGYAREHHCQVVLEGQNADDRLDFRPGSKAVMETGTLSPLAHNELTKAEIRQLAKELGLSTWDMPSSPCLATRIPYGTPITMEALNQVSLAENYLHERGFKITRVRYFHDMAKIEIEPDRIPALLAMREDLVSAFKQMGFTQVTLDLQGYRLGSMNEGLAR